MPTHAASRKPARHWRATARGAALFATLIAVSVALLVEGVDFDPSIGNRRFHSSLETADAMVLVFVAAVVVGRLRTDGSRRNLLLLIGLVVLASKNLFHAVATMVLDDITGTHTVVWGTAFNGVVGAGLLAAAGAVHDQIPRRVWTAGRCVVTGAAVVIAIMIVTAVADPLLPEAFEQLPEEATELGLLSGHPSKIVIDLATALLYGVAGVCFARHADANDDEFLRWLSIASLIAAVAFVNYAMFPSRFTQLMYGGEILWLGAIVTLLYGAVREISNTEAELVRTAVLAERRRVARDLHDGVAQELSYIASQTNWYRRQPPEAQPLGQIQVAVERALEESRAAIAALSRPLNEPLADALEHAAVDVADRLGARVDLDLDDNIEVTPEWREAFTRIAREAVSNAVRHGRARKISLQLRSDERVTLRVVDNGVGFDPSAPRSSQSFGLTGMRERTESLGGEFHLTSHLGVGTEVEVILP